MEGLILKTFLIDTNVFLYDPLCLEVFEDNEVVIPLTVLDELDSAKTRPDEVGRNARSVVRVLDELRNLGSLNDGVKYNNSIIKVELNNSSLPSGLTSEKADNKIIGTAIHLKSQGKNVIIISKDINMRVKCDALGMQTQDYTTGKMAKEMEQVYSGVSKVFVPSAMINELYSLGSVETNFPAFPNQFFILKSEENESQSVIVRYKKGKLYLLRNCPKDGIMGITPRNAEQRMALDLLLDPDIKLVTLLGKAGSGKTLLATAASLQQVVKEQKVFNRVLISRPIQPMGRDLGFLPGTIDEKLRPWMQPIYDNLEFILGTSFENSGMYEELIQVEPLTYIRGRSIPKSFMILDEAQNLTIREVKTIVTRIGSDSKIILTGDIEQIDSPYIDFADNGLTYIVEKFKEYDIAGHITLRKGERSELATLASEIL